MRDYSERDGYSQHSHHNHPVHHGRRRLWFGLLFLLIVLLGLSALFSLVSARLAANIMNKSVVISSVGIHFGSVYRARSGSGSGSTSPYYAYNELHVMNDPTTYIYFRDAFSPSLPTNLANGGAIYATGEIWYVESLYPVPFRLEIVAIQLQEQGSLRPERFVTAAFTSPQPSYVPGLSLAAIAAILLAVFLWRPTGRSLLSNVFGWSRPRSITTGSHESRPPHAGRLSAAAHPTDHHQASRSSHQAHTRLHEEVVNNDLDQ